MVDPIVFPLSCKRLSGATRWQTNYSSGRSGAQVRNGDWEDALRRFNAAYGLKTLADQAVLESWFLVCQGPVIGFLLRDEKDYQIAQGTNGAMVNLNPGTDTIFQISKTYTNGYRSYIRRITRPESGTLTVYDAAHALISSGYSVDYTTGKVTFTTQQTGARYASCNFYVPVHFKEDEIPWDIIKLVLATRKGYGQLPEVILEEERE